MFAVRFDMKVAAIIVAAGSGKRMLSAVKKQYLELKGRSVLSYTLEKFQLSDSVDDIVLVVGKEETGFVQDEIVDKYSFSKVKAVVAGGKERAESVKNGLSLIDESCDVVLIHDGVRPFLSEALIDRCISAANEYGACIAAVPVKDTIKISDKVGFVAQTPDRSSLWAAQTPQAFKYEIIKKAYECPDLKATDDSMLAEACGVKVKIVEGEYENIKITTPEDMLIAEGLIASK